MFLENLQNSQENTCIRISFLIKLQASSGRLLLQIEGKTNTRVFVDTYTDAQILGSFNWLVYLIPCASQKMKFSIKDFFSKCDQIQRKLRIFTFTEEILDGKLQFLCSVENVNLSHFYPYELFFLLLLNCYSLNYRLFL